MPRRSVDIIRKRAEHLGTVEAKDERSALAAAAAKVNIEPVLRNRLSVCKISKDDK